MSHYVLIQQPRREGVYVKCRSVDQCLDVVQSEAAQSEVGTRLTMFRKRPRQFAELVAVWRVDASGTRRYSVNGLDLSHLLAPPGQVPQIGAETGKARRDGISRFRSEHGSFRYVLYDDGEPISALQVVAPPAPKRGKWRATVANVYTVPSRRRQRHAQRLLSAARQDFDEVLHSPHDLSTEGDIWKAAVG